jgi:hypothetical protein
MTASHCIAVLAVPTGAGGGSLTLTGPSIDKMALLAVRTAHFSLGRSAVQLSPNPHKGLSSMEMSINGFLWVRNSSIWVVSVIGVK